MHIICKQDARQALTRATWVFAIARISCKIRNAMRMYHCEVRTTFSRRFGIRFKQTFELHPDMNISSYSSAVSFLLDNLQLKNTIQEYMLCIGMLSNSHFQTGLNLESIHINFKRECIMSHAARRTLYTYEFYISDYLE